MQCIVCNCWSDQHGTDFYIRLELHIYFPSLQQHSYFKIYHFGILSCSFKWNMSTCGGIDSHTVERTKLRLYTKCCTEGKCVSKWDVQSAVELSNISLRQTSDIHLWLFPWLKHSDMFLFLFRLKWFRTARLLHELMYHRKWTSLWNPREDKMKFLRYNEIHRHILLLFESLEWSVK